MKSYEMMWQRLPLHTCANARELGGYPTADGSQTAWHRFVRSDRLSFLDDDEREFLYGYGVRTVIDLRGIDGAIAQYFVVCQGNTPTQVEAITDSVEETARIDMGEKPVRTVGLELAHWVAMDYTDVMVHIFVPDMRSYYNIENLWQDAPQTEVPNLD